MPRKKSGLFDQSKYVQQYMKDNIKQVKVSLNKNKPDDMQMIAWIAQQQEGASGYIKRLIRQDMGKKQPVRCRDCKHYHPGFTCDLMQKPIMKGDDWFCADGERK